MLLLALLLISPLESGQQAFRVRNWPAAERFFAQALRDQPSSPAPHKWLGMTYAAQQKFVLAQAPFRRACQLDPRDPDACYYYGRTLFALGRLELSVDAYEKARKTGVRLGRVYLGLALSHEKLDHRDDAERYFKLALAAGETQARADYERFLRQSRPLPLGTTPRFRNKRPVLVLQQVDCQFAVATSSGERYSARSALGSVRTVVPNV